MSLRSEARFFKCVEERRNAGFIILEILSLRYVAHFACFRRAKKFRIMRSSFDVLIPYPFRKQLAFIVCSPVTASRARIIMIIIQFYSSRNVIHFWGKKIMIIIISRLGTIFFVYIFIGPKEPAKEEPAVVSFVSVLFCLRHYF